MTEYHKIQTVYERDEKTHKLIEPLVLRNPVYGLLKTWEWTEKIDGTNIRVIWDGSKVNFAGRTDAANIDPQLWKYLIDTFTIEKLSHAFPENTPAVLYGEGYGAGIQKGGAYSSTKRFILFDVMVADKWWLSWKNVEDVAIKLAIESVPFYGVYDLEAATALVRKGLLSRLAARNGQELQAEGLIGRPPEALFDKKGKRLIIKLKTKDFAKVGVTA